MRTVKAFAPASVANVFVGFDILGFSVSVLGDHITLRQTAEPTSISQIRGISSIPSEVDQNTAGYALMRFAEDVGIDHGFEITIDKGIPLASGLGGSAASAVAAVVAGNQFLDEPLSREKLMPYALAGERVASGSAHGDNVAASMFGGLTAYVGSGSIPEVIQVPVPDDLYAVIVHPHIKITTKSARSVIANTVPLKAHITQSMALIRLLAACHRNDLTYLTDGLQDAIIEDQRAHLIPGFERLQTTAVDHGCLGFTISGAGPACVGLAAGLPIAHQVRHSLEELSSELPYDTSVWVTRLGSAGARLLEVKS